MQALSLARLSTATMRPLMSAAMAQRSFHAAPQALFAAGGAGDSATATYISTAEAAERVMKVCKDFGKVDPAKVSESSAFIADLGLDSLDQVELVMALEEEFVVDLDDAQAESIQTVADAVKLMSEHPMAK
eukprot:SAG22_NODE_511_length_9594_cov_4.553449_8_plen_131_part_00